MKINIIPSCVLVASMLLSTSCSDFLTEDPKGQLSGENFFQSKADLDQAVYSLYSYVQGFQSYSNMVIVQTMGDDVTSTTGSNKAAYLAADAFQAPSDLKGVNELWSWSYNIIKSANFVLESAKKLKAEGNELNIDLGQAYFWRAYAYYGLVRNYGPLPLVLSTEAGADANQMPLSSVEDVYKQIVADLTAAEQCNLPETYTEANMSIDGANIYVSSQAVKSALAAVYMSMAGYPLKKTEYYASAADKAKEVIDAVNSRGVQTFLSDWNDVYNYGMNNHKECILGIYYNSITGSWGWDDSSLTSCHTLQYYKDWQGWGDFIPERLFWAQYPDGPRKDAVYCKTMLTNEGNNVDWWATTDGKVISNDKKNAVISDYRPMFTGFAVNMDATGAPVKAAFDCTKPIYAGMTLGKRHQLIRYAEVLCWFAEASARSHKYSAEAREALKKVRARAWGDQNAINAVSNMSDDELAEAAYNEHRYEVAGNVLAMVTCREDQFRMERLKNAFDYRAGNQTSVLVKKGTLTHSQDVNGNVFTYTLPEDLVIKEEMDVTGSWKGEESMYSIYPPSETEHNPNIHR